jgi:uncharacterized membrane protein YtjA (UPF0391 family)
LLEWYDKAVFTLRDVIPPAAQCADALDGDAERSLGRSRIGFSRGRKDHMLTWAIILAVVALIAGALGFSGVAAGAATIAKVLFGIFLIIALILFVIVVIGVGAAV